MSCASPGGNAMPIGSSVKVLPRALRPEPGGRSSAKWQVSRSASSVGLSAHHQLPHCVRRRQEMRPHELPVALLVLRVGLGVFLLLWSIDKAPEQTAKIFQFFCNPPAHELR